MRIAILGNSGSGKSTLARRLAGQEGLPVLDLDTVVWEPNAIAVARPESRVLADLEAFCSATDGWIVEGCYAGAVAASLRWRPELLFLDPGEEACLAHCRARPWEPHKYATREAQDEKLPFLLAWVSEYYRRDGDMSLRAHRAVYDAYDGPKREITSDDGAR